MQDELRRRLEQQRQQQQQPQQGGRSYEAKETARRIGALGLTIRNLTEQLADTDPEQWELNAQSLAVRMQEVIQQFRQELEAQVRERQQIQTQSNRQFTPQQVDQF